MKMTAKRLKVIDDFAGDKYDDQFTLGIVSEDTTVIAGHFLAKFP